MKKVSLALFLSAMALGGVAHAQEGRPVNTVITSTDPATVAQVEQHARDVQMSAQRANDMQAQSEKPMHKGMRHHRKNDRMGQ